MADQQQAASGPPMLSMTSALRPPPARISKIGENLTLPVSVQINQLVAGSIGAFAGLVLSLLVLGPFIGVSIVTAGAGLGLGVLAGLLAVTWSPLKGESLGTWLGLNFTTFRGDRVEIDGVPARAFIGIAPLRCSAAGETHVVARAVNVPAGTVDDRGVIVPLREQRGAPASFPTRLPGPEDGFEPARRLRNDDVVPERKVLRRGSNSVAAPDRWTPPNTDRR